MQNSKSRKQFIQRLRSTPVLVTASCLVVAATVVPQLVRADTYTDQINALKQQNAAAQDSLNTLMSQAATYQDAINQLQAQINAVQAAIAANEAQQAQLQEQITDDQNQIEQQKLVLANDVKTMYVNGQMTPVEMLATSDSISTYIDKQEAYSAVQDKIQSTMDQITALEQKLQAQKAQVDQLLTQQHQQNDQLGAAQAQQAQLLAYNQDQQDQFNAQLAANNSKISQLRAQQAAAYAAYSSKSGVLSYGVGSDGNGGYPSIWANATQDSMVDSWGGYNRECVSYAAWKEASQGKYVPYGLGNAADWASNASAYGIKVSSTPSVGTIAQWGAYAGLGTLGHVAYVEAVNGDGSIEVSQYNFVHGQFSRMHVPAGDVARLNFIYF